MATEHCECHLEFNVHGPETFREVERAVAQLLRTDPSHCPFLSSGAFARLRLAALYGAAEQSVVAEHPSGLAAALGPAAGRVTIHRRFLCPGG